MPSGSDRIHPNSPGVVLGQIQRDVEMLKREKRPMMSSALTGGYATYPQGVQAISSLVGYWPLTDGASPYSELSGLAPSDPAVASGGSPAMTYDYTPGPLLIADAGAVEFTSPTGASTAEYLSVADGVPRRLNLNATDFTLSAWVKIHSSATSFNGPIMTNQGIGGIGGWGLFVLWPNREVIFACNEGGSPNSSFSADAGAMAADTWVHVVGTFTLSDPTYTNHTMGRLYINGAFVVANGALNSGSPATISLPTYNGGFFFGKELTFSKGFYGGVAQAAIYSKALSPAEVFTLYASGNAAAAGTELIADGSGGFALTTPYVYVDGA